MSIKLEVSTNTYNEIEIALKRAGRTINDGVPLEIEKNTSFVQPVDFRMVAIRQNCLIPAAQAYVPPRDVDGEPKHNGEKFITFADEIFNYVLNGREVNTNPDKASTVKTKW